MLADSRPINVRPWLYRIARNRCLNHLRRIQAVGVDSMDIHYSDHGASTADKVHDREAFRLLVGDINELPETQRTALVLREMDALSYEQIAEAMETTVPSVKSLLVRARISLAEAAEARVLSCDEVRIELGEVAEGLRRRPSPLVRRHLKSCKRCETFRGQLRETNKALAALLPIGPFILLKKIALTHIGHSAGSGATAAGSSAAGSTAAATGGSFMVGSSTSGFVSAGLGAVATKTAAGLAAAALVTAGAVEVDHSASPGNHAPPTVATPNPHAASGGAPVGQTSAPPTLHRVVLKKKAVTADAKKADTTTLAAATTTTTPATTTTPPTTTAATTPTTTTLPGRTHTQTDPTILQGPANESNSNPTSTTATDPASTTTTASGSSTTTTTETAPTTTSSSGGTAPTGDPSAP
jgi:hypothetical protein